MNWTEIKLFVKTDDTDTAGDIAVTAVPYGIYIEDYSDLESVALEVAHIDLIDEDLLNKNREQSVIHIYIGEKENPDEALSYIKERLEECKIAYGLEVNGCSEEDWANNWKKYFKPFPVGKKLFILPEWETDYDSGNRKVLTIEPGAAFGTGSHDTTRLCLETLENYVYKDCSVLDIGCGSGILAICSMLLGAKEGFGVDIDPLAVKTAKENGEKNGFAEPELSFVCGDLTDKVTKKYDIVVANIVADVIIYFSTLVKSFMNDAAVFITSGIIDSRKDEVAEAIKQNGMEIIEKHENGGWVCFVSRLQRGI